MVIILTSLIGASTSMTQNLQLPDVFWDHILTQIYNHSTVAPSISDVQEALDDSATLLQLTYTKTLTFPGRGAGLPQLHNVNAIQSCLKEAPCSLVSPVPECSLWPREWRERSHLACYPNRTVFIYNPSDSKYVGVFPHNNQFSTWLRSQHQMRVLQLSSILTLTTQKICRKQLWGFRKQFRLLSNDQYTLGNRAFLSLEDTVKLGLHWREK